MINQTCSTVVYDINPLKAELNPICHLLALLGGATIVVVSRLRVKVSCWTANVRSCMIQKIYNGMHQIKRVAFRNFTNASKM